MRQKRLLLPFLIALLLACGGAALLLACGGEEASAGEAPPVVDVVDETPPDIELVEPEEARATWAEDTYELTSVATGAYVVGTPSTFEVRLTPRGEYHVNVAYPWSMTVTPPATLTVPTATFDSTTAAEMTETVARFVVPFTPTAAGSHNVTAAVDFGICREEACIFQMRNVLVTLVVAEAGAPGEPTPPGDTVPAAVPPGGEAAPGAPAGGPPVPDLAGGISATDPAPTHPVPDLAGGRSAIDGSPRIDAPPPGARGLLPDVAAGRA